MQANDRLIMPPSFSRPSNWLLLLIPGAIWGASFLFIAEGLQSVGPHGVAFARILVGFLTLSLIPGARNRVPRAEWGSIVGLGILWMALPLNLFALAEQHVSSAVTGMLNGANPIFTAVVASLLARRLPERGIWVGLVVGFSGTLLTALPAIYEGQNSACGVFMIVAALVCYGFALNLAGPLQKRNGTLSILWRALFVALLLSAPLGAPELLHARWTLASGLSLLALGALGTGLAYVALSIAAARMGAPRASATTYLIPAVAVLLGNLVRHDAISAMALIGSAISVMGAWLMKRSVRLVLPSEQGHDRNLLISPTPGAGILIAQEPEPQGVLE